MRKESEHNTKENYQTQRKRERKKKKKNRHKLQKQSEKTINNIATSR